jgi:ABC-type multidrug transport system fused ATPase/permease subunit
MSETKIDRKDRHTEHVQLDDTSEGGRLETLGSMFRLLGMLRSYKRRVATVLGFGFVATGCMVAIPWLVAMVIDRHITKGSAVSELAPLLAALLALSLLQFGAQYMNQRTQTLLGHNLLYDQRIAVFDHMLRLSMTFYDRNQIGRVMSRVQNDVQQIQGVMNVGMLALSESFILFGITIGMLALDVRLALISLASVVLIFPVLIAWQRYARAAYIRARQTVAEVNARLQENLTAVKVVQSLGREDSNAERFEEASRATEKANIEATKFGAALVPSVETLNSMGLALVVLFGGMMVLGGSLEVGVLVAFALYITRFFEPVEGLIERYAILQRAIVSTARIFEMLDIEPLLKDRSDAIELPEISGAIEYDGVGFHYVEGTPVLSDVTLRANPGETVALVGPTGAGKTTLVSLLMRFYDVVDGSIMIDGHDLRDVTLDSLSSQMSVVLQEPHLFIGTVKENIKYNRTGASDQDVVDAAEAVGAHDFITRLPDGYDTEIREGGSNLSVGQRQLISFARALVADPRILILDEATASIDTESEAIIQEALHKLLKDRTALVIAHRLSTIKSADRIVALENGRIVEQGTHDQLVANEGLYSRLLSYSDTAEESDPNGTDA